MTPDGSQIIHGHVIDVLKGLPDESVHCVVTSPPYWALRSYQVPATVWDGDAECEHEWGEQVVTDRRGTQLGKAVVVDARASTRGAFCRRCGAWRGQLGLEPTVDLYVEHIVAVFREVKRVLRRDGVCFINMGDCYATGLQSSSVAGILRQDLTQEEVAYVCLEMFGVRLDGAEEESERLLSEVLSKEVQEGTSRAKAGTPTGLLSQKREGVQCPNQSAEQAAPNGDGSGPGRKVRMLRRDGASLSLPRSHQGGRKAGIQEEGRLSGGLEKSNRGRITAGEIPDSVLELQRRSRLIRALSAFRFDFAHIPTPLQRYFRKVASGLKPKDLVMMPARIALALQADGWWVRSDIVWHKPNPMPESCRDRPTKAHEFIFLMTKAARYFYDADAVRQGSQVYRRKAGGYKDHKDQMAGYSPFKGKGGFADSDVITVGANLRSVWTFPTRACSYSHYATFPYALPERCILAGTSERGCCPECGAPWARVVEKERRFESGSGRSGNAIAGKQAAVQGGGETHDVRRGPCVDVTTTGWRPTCECCHDNGPEFRETLIRSRPQPCTVLDPFAGTGTTCLVAKRLGRRYLGVELNPKDVAYARDALRNQEASLI